MKKTAVIISFLFVFNPLQAADDYFGGREAQTIEGNVSINDATSGIPTIVSLPLYGTLDSTNGLGELGSDGSFTYTPSTGFSGVDAFVYSINNELYEARLFSGSVQVLSANDPDLGLSVASASNRTLVELQPRSDDAGASWTITHAGNALEFESDLSAGNSVVMETWMPNASGEQVSIYTRNNKIWQDFTLESNLLGNHEIRSEFTQFTINRIAGTDLIAEVASPNSSDDWLITGVDQVAPPSAVDDRYVIAVDEVLNENVLSNDSANSIDFASFLVSRPQNGQFIGINESIYGGLAPFGAFTYQPDPGFEGSDQFTYFSLGTANGAPSTLTTVTIRVGNLNNPIANDDLFSGAEDGVISERVLSNDVNAGGGFFDPQAVLVAPPRYGSFIGINESIYGGLAPFGDFDYQPDPGFNGVDSFAYKIINSGVESPVATVYLVVGEVKIAPKEDWRLKLGTEGLSNRTSFSLLERNQNPEQNFQIQALANSERFYLPYAGKALETWMPQAQGLDATLYTFNGKPWQQFSIDLVPSGAVIIKSTYTGTVLQPENLSLGAEIKTQALTGNENQQWLIAGPNQTFPTSAMDDTFSVTVDSLLEGDVLNNDQVNGFDFFSELVSPPSHGELVGIGALIYDGLTPWGAFEYQPDPGFVGQDQFIYQAFSSFSGAPSRYVTVTIQVID